MNLTARQQEYVMAMLEARSVDSVKEPLSLSSSEIEGCKRLARMNLTEREANAYRKHWEYDLPPERVKILHEGATITHGPRDAEYGPPAVNMACAGALKKALREHMTRDISPAELEAIDLALTKIGRLATGTPKRDTYVDAATYLAIAGEIGLSGKSE